MGTFSPYMTKSWLIQSVADIARGRYSLTKTTPTATAFSFVRTAAEVVRYKLRDIRRQFLVSCPKCEGYTPLSSVTENWKDRSETDQVGDQTKGVDNIPTFSVPLHDRSKILRPIPEGVCAFSFRFSDVEKSWRECNSRL